MKRENRLLSLTLCASAALHAGVILFLAVNYKSLAGTPEPEQGAGVFALVNISVPEEPVPVVQPPEPLPVSVVIPEPENAPAEIFIAAEEIPPEAERPAVPAELPAAFSAAPGAGTPQGGTGRTGPETERNAALVETYIRRNFTYIQRRIRDRLVYPSPARRAGIQGVTEVSFIIHEDGRVSAVTVRAGSGHAVLDKAAVATIHAAAPFPKPPAAARIAIPIAFRLR